MSKIIITIVGQDRVGIVAKTCNYLADHNMNILDITQTILQEYRIPKGRKYELLLMPNLFLFRLERK